MSRTRSQIANANLRAGIDAADGPAACSAQMDEEELLRKEKRGMAPRVMAPLGPSGFTFPISGGA